MRRKTTKAAPRRHTPLSLLGDGILLFLVLAGTVGCFATAFTLPVALPLIYAGCGLAALLGLLLWALPRRAGLPLLGCVAALWAFGLWRLWELLVLGEIALRCAVVNTFCTSLELDGFIRPIAQLSPSVWAAVATLLVLLALVPLGVLLGLVMVGRRSFWLTFLCSAPLPAAALCISVTPGWLPLCALLLAWMTLGLTALTDRSDRRGTARLTLAVLPAAALTLALLALALPQEGYQRPQWADDALDGLSNWAARQDLALFSGRGPFGGGGTLLADADGKVSLADAGPLRFSGRTVLEVDTELRGRIYLRGFSSAVYEDGSWGPLEESDYLQVGPYQYSMEEFSGQLSLSDLSNALGGYQPLNFPALADRESFPGKDYAKYTVRNTGADPGYVYVPYHILSQPEELSGTEFMYDSYLARMEDVWTHTVYVQPGCDPLSGAELPWETAQAESTYANFVYDRSYTAIDEDAADAVFDALNELSGNPAQSLPGGLNNEHLQAYSSYISYGRLSETDSRAAVLSLAGMIGDYLSQLAEYDPDTPATPEGEDFVSYFLTESHEGYCMHFASAATLMLRAIGIPARYVTGYVADVPASGHVNVPDSAAHAWVEIYINGYGWEPIEVTPAYAGSSPGQSATEETEPSPTPTAAPTPSATQAPQASVPPSAAPSAAPSGVGTGTGGLPGSLAAALIALLVLLALPARRALGRAGRERRFRQESANAAVIAAYLHLKKLEKWGGQTPEEVFDLAKKAKFSPHTLTEAERSTAAEAARAVSAQVDRALPWYKRFLCRYVLGLC